MSFLKDRMGEAVFAPGINIIDDPHRLRGLRSKPFDGEGVANRRMALIENGVLKSWLLDCAQRQAAWALSTTGHAARGTGGPPSPSSTNLYMEPGTLSPEELMADIKDGFYVTELMGMGVNGVTGDYSRGAAGFWIENGKIAYPVSGVTIAGNLKDMFAQSHARQRSGLPLRHQRADLARRRHDPCRRVTLRADRWRRCARPARSRGNIFGGNYKQWDKGKGQPVTEADLAVDQFLLRNAARRAARLWLAVGRDRGRSRAARRRRHLRRRSHRRHHRLREGQAAFHHLRRHRARGRARVRAWCSIRSPKNVSRPSEGEGATLNGAPIHVSAQREIEGCRMLRDEIAVRTSRLEQAAATRPGRRCTSRRAAPSPIAWRWSRAGAVRRHAGAFRQA